MRVFLGATVYPACVAHAVQLGRPGEEYGRLYKWRVNTYALAEIALHQVGWKNPPNAIKVMANVLLQ